MELKYNVTGNDRKRLVAAVSEITETPATYLGAPTFAYEIDCFIIDRNGTVSFDNRADSEEIEMLIERLMDMGFEPEEAETTGLTVNIPLDKVNVGNLTNLLNAKGALIQKALGITATPIEIHEDCVSFPWFDTLPPPEEVNAYSRFIGKLCGMTTSQKRINATEKPAENDKYAFRCFLLRLGFIGDEYKAERKLLLSSLSGSSAFKGGAGDAVSE